MKNAALKKIPKKTDINLNVVENETYLKELGPLQDWQIARIRKSMESYRKGNVLTEEEMEKTFDKFLED
ncbi:MAG: hypothetical protein LBQ34_01345 [Alphaproteobacteria bacterium]|jgi:predicted transcriptional regulator|nr:hypothetical protein [Alphaproteobacteria bacterium]